MATNKYDGVIKILEQPQRDILDIMQSKSGLSKYASEAAMSINRMAETLAKHARDQNVIASIWPPRSGLLLSVSTLLDCIKTMTKGVSGALPIPVVEDETTFKLGVAYLGLLNAFNVAKCPDAQDFLTALQAAGKEWVENLTIHSPQELTINLIQFFHTSDHETKGRLLSFVNEASLPELLKKLDVVTQFEANNDTTKAAEANIEQIKTSLKSMSNIPILQMLRLRAILYRIRKNINSTKTEANEGTAILRDHKLSGRYKQLETNIAALIEKKELLIQTQMEVRQELGRLRIRLSEIESQRVTKASQEESVVSSVSTNILGAITSVLKHTPANAIAGGVMIDLLQNWTEVPRSESQNLNQEKETISSRLPIIEEELQQIGEKLKQTAAHLSQSEQQQIELKQLCEAEAKLNQIRANVHYLSIEGNEHLSHLAKRLSFIMSGTGTPANINTQGWFIDWDNRMDVLENCFLQIDSIVGNQFSHCASDLVQLQLTITQQKETVANLKKAHEEALEQEQDLEQREKTAIAFHGMIINKATRKVTQSISHFKMLLLTSPVVPYLSTLAFLVGVAVATIALGVLCANPAFALFAGLGIAMPYLLTGAVVGSAVAAVAVGLTVYRSSFFVKSAMAANAAPALGLDEGVTDSAAAKVA
ncbi:MAG: hypothetical protein Q8R83_00810 [Legionellaceae bacterium]|nr:hypothetical protein [Legionellaceae bacterium]